MSEIDVREVAGRVVCDGTLASCRCREAAGHHPATPHCCPCGGSWRGSGPGAEIVSLPALRFTPIPGLGYKDVW
jgi:hypothetical protein